MNKEDKELLLKDLSARLPYGVCVHIRYKEGEPCYGKLTPRDIQWFIDSKIEVIKPYLRPMSSMTKEEKQKMSNGSAIAFEAALNNISGYCPETMAYCAFNIDFCLSHHLDYRGLIEKGLAIEAPEGMYNIK